MIQYQFDQYLPGISLDSVIFGFHQNTLKVLLLKIKNMQLWSLPGGFVQKNENVNDAAVRVLLERTGLDDIFLHQFEVFGNVDRIQQSHVDMLIDQGFFDAGSESETWFRQRFVTIGYYALVEYSKVKSPQPDAVSESCDWFDIHDLPTLMVDHTHIVQQAYEKLKHNLNHQPIGLNLLPKRFTMPELQSLYETILGYELDRRNFQRKILSYDILIRTNEQRRGGSHKAPWLYEFDENNYQKALEDGLKSNW